MRGYSANPHYCLEGGTPPNRYSLPGWLVDERSISEGILSFIEYAPRLRIVLPSRQKRMERASHFFRLQAIFCLYFVFLMSSGRQVWLFTGSLKGSRGNKRTRLPGMAASQTYKGRHKEVFWSCFISKISNRFSSWFSPKIFSRFLSEERAKRGRIRFPIFSAWIFSRFSAWIFQHGF